MQIYTVQYIYKTMQNNLKACIFQISYKPSSLKIINKSRLEDAEFY